MQPNNADSSFKLLTQPGPANDFEDRQPIPQSGPPTCPSVAAYLHAEIPVFVPCFNNPTYVRNMVRQLRKLHFRKIVLVDNASTYPPMRAYLGSLAGEVGMVALSENKGPRDIFMDENNYAMLPQYFCITDPDLLFNDELPHDFLAELLLLTEKHKVGKAGFSLDISDRSEMREDDVVYGGKSYKIWEWEEQFWRQALERLTGGDQVYRAWIDTTFALYNKTYFHRRAIFEALRVAGRYTCRHLPWYRDSGLPKIEEAFYRNTAKFSCYLQPDHASADEAVESCRRAVALNPDHASAHFDLGNVLRERGKLDEAIENYRRALALDPDRPDYHHGLGIALMDHDRVEEAIGCYRHAIALAPDHYAAHLNLGAALHTQGNSAEAEASCWQALAVKPDYAFAYDKLGQILIFQGRAGEAAAYYRRAQELAPYDPLVHSNLLLCLQCDPAMTPGALLLEHRAYAARLPSTAPPAHAGPRDPDKRLNIGYLSPNLRLNAVGFLLMPVLATHDRANFKIHCYYGHRQADAGTVFLKSRAEVWRSTVGIGDEDLAAMIRADGIDILVDLSGHTPNNRLPVFARKPAPVQATWAGYFGTTGLDAIDYLITDRFLSPPGSERYAVEKLVRLPDAYLCWAVPSGAPPVGPLPAAAPGAVTFGCFQNLGKINPLVIALWGRLLRELPRSRLVLKTAQRGDPAAFERIIELFAAEGIADNRIVLEGRSPLREYFKRYNDIDIALDPFPYSGGLTTFDALWMGVPVITLGGERSAARHSLSHLNVVGLGELVADGPEAYLRIAIELAHDLPRLAALRAGLRERLRTSPLVQADRFTRGLEQAFRAMWRDWCEGAGHRTEPSFVHGVPAKIEHLAADVAVVSAADAKFFDLLQGMARSLRDKPQGREIALYVFDIGLSEAQRQWLQGQGATLHSPPIQPYGHGLALYLSGITTTRCRIPELFPGHEVYLWIDADAWIQRWDAIERYAESALDRGFAITPETDPAYDRATVLAVHEPSFAMFGTEYLEQLRATGPVNCGVFAGRADAPHWQAWRQMMEANIGKADTTFLRFLLDQTALCVVCKQAGFETALLPTTCNWVSHIAHPMTSDDGAMLLRPLPPHEALGIVHQTHNTKRAFFPLRRLNGGFLSRTLSYQAHSQLAADDYVSPGLQVVVPDRCFPNMVRVHQSASKWSYLRRGLPHAWLVDRRCPTWGFLNRDEAHILYNLALGFHGKRALEIGCLMGWSACHIALAGLDLDIIDPLLADEQVLASVRSSLQGCRFPGRVNLIPSRSPAAVHQIAKAHPEGWSFFFIDGDHDGDAPLNDVKACQPYATPDCAMVFHDIASPHVTNAVLHLKAQGWQTRVYHTAQIMAVAWRGNIEPIAHQPDPRIDWRIPDHVNPLLV